MKVYLAYARVCYSLVVAVSAIAASYSAFLAVTGLATWSAMSWLLVAGCSSGLLFLGGKAVVRTFRGRLLLSQPIGDNQVANFFFMTLLGSFGHLCTAVICNAFYIVFTRKDEMPNPIVFVMALAAVCYLAALWIGELVLQRNQPTSPQSQHRQIQ